MPAPEAFQFFSLRDQGSALVPYEKAWALQKTLVDRRARDEIPDTFLFVEHPSVITRGRGLQWKPDRDARATPLGPIPEGTSYYEIERGGDLTWHGPGQLVVYPIVKLDGSGFGPDHDIGAYLRKLERCVGKWLSRYGLVSQSVENAAGIWVRRSDEEGEAALRKIASVGIAVRKWVTYHGIGLNLANALDPYSIFSPCGFAPEVMTTLMHESNEFRSKPWSITTRSEVEIEIARSFFPESARIQIQVL